MLSLALFLVLSLPIRSGAVRVGEGAHAASWGRLWPWQQKNEGDTRRGAGEDLKTKDLSGFWLAALGIYLVVLLLAVRAYVWLLPNPPDKEVEECRRLRSSSNEVTLDITDYSLDLKWGCSIRFKDKSAEMKWYEYSATSKIAASARVLCLVGAFTICHEVLRIFQSAARLRNWVVHVPTTIVVVLVTSLAFACWKEPLESLYWPLLLFFYFYFPAASMPPFMASCKALHETETSFKDEKDPKWWFLMDESVKHSDCQLEGHSSMQILMTWLLLQPWVIPQLEHMYVVGLWIFGVLLGWILVYRWMSKSEVFGCWDTLYRLILLSVTLAMSIIKKYSLEKSRRLKFLQGLEQKASTKRIFHILEFMMPIHVIPSMLKDQNAAIADSVNRVSILFILIADFQTFARRMLPSELLTFLNRQFTRFDDICSANKVTKIETVCEEYVACVGVLPGDKEENARSGHGALLERLFGAAGQILQLQTDEVKFKMGVHSGPIVAGVIGTKLPRYRLFGDTINSAARMMQKGIPGQLQFGTETYRDLPEILKEQVKLRGDVEMKGKGRVTAYTFEPSESFSMKPTETWSNAKRQQGKQSVRQSICQQDMVPQLSRSDESPSLSDQRFEDTLKQMAAYESKAKKRLILSQRDGFTEEMERDWYKWFHENSICHKIVRRFGSQAISVLIITGIELMSLMWQYDKERAGTHEKDLTPQFSFAHPLYEGKYRLAVYIYCRGFVVLLEMIWWYCAESSSWIKEHPGSSQFLILLSSCFNLAAMYISYDALVISNTKKWWRWRNLHQDITVPWDQVCTLNFALFVFLFVRRHELLFCPTVLFLPVAAVVICIPRFCQWIFGNEDNQKYQEWTSMFPMQAEALLLMQVVIHIIIAHEEEQSSRSRFKSKTAVEITKKRTENILETLMPPLVVQQLRSLSVNEPNPTHTYRHATIAQSDLCGFTQLSSTRKASEVVQFMSDLFGAFDVLTDVHEVYKVETVGDAYIAGMAEQPLTKENSPINVVLFGLDMVRAVDKWARNMGVNVNCRVGIHYGECIGGIVGTDMQRYHLFGDLLSVLEILESTAPEGRVQVSEACRLEVVRQMREEVGIQRKETVSFQLREDPELKTSKGEIHHYSEVGGTTSVVQSSLELRHMKPAKNAGAILGQCV